MIALGLGPQALGHHRQLLAIAERLAATDPTNAGFQRDLSVSYNKLGDLMVGLDNGAEAERFFRDGLAIAERLAATDPTNAGFQRDLSVSYNKLGDPARNAGRVEDAIGLFETSLGTWRCLAEASAEVVDFRWEQRLPLSRLAALLVGRDPVAAVSHLSDLLAIVSGEAEAQGEDPRAGGRAQSRGRPSRRTPSSAQWCVDDGSSRP